MPSAAGSALNCAASACSASSPARPASAATRAPAKKSTSPQAKPCASSPARNCRAWKLPPKPRNNSSACLRINLEPPKLTGCGGTRKYVIPNQVRFLNGVRNLLFPWPSCEQQIPHPQTTRVREDKRAFFRSLLNIGTQPQFCTNPEVVLY